MKKYSLFYFSILSVFNSFAQLPNTDIWLLDIKTEKYNLSLSNPINISNRVGYDNQPAFSTDNKYILYTSVRDEKQSDIYKYDFKSKSITQFTKTSTSEYSPSFMPDGQNISVVMVETDSSQRLWKFPIKGGDPSVLIKKIDSIGYHCWLDDTHVALFLITEPMKLIFADINTDKSIFVKDTIGRSMHSLKSKDGIHFIYSYKGGIYSTDLNNTKTILQSTKKFKGEDFCLFNESTIIMGDSSKLYLNHMPNKGFKDKNEGWDEIIDLSKYGIINISRIAISPDKKKLAIVAESK